MVIFTAIGLLFTGMFTLVLLHALYISATSRTTFIDYLKEIYMPDTDDCDDYQCPECGQWVGSIIPDEHLD